MNTIIVEGGKDMGNRIYPIGIQNFEKIRKEGYVYVDKTALMYKLVKSGSYFFLSRPRRFGKSLLISTLEAYFEAKRDLFEGLAVEALEKDWVKRPVLHLDLNIGKYDTPDSLDKILDKNLSKWEELYGTGVAESTLALRFAGAVERAYEQSGERVAILIDEYDKPLLQAIGNEELQREFRNTLKPFYGVLKTMDGCIKFALLTGVTKFGKVSVFSDLNNLNDISMDEPFISICGITEKEIHLNFEEDLHELAAAQKMTYQEVCNELKACYDGYHFTENTDGIYNPFSLLKAMALGEIGSYWFESGTPTYIIEMLRKYAVLPSEIGGEEASPSDFNVPLELATNYMPLLYQAGYLTIKGADLEFDAYMLDIPNKEVRVGLMKSLIPSYVTSDSHEVNSVVRNLARNIVRGDMDEALKLLQAFLSTVPYCDNTDYEGHYQQMLYVIFSLLGIYTDVEVHTLKGRVDMVLRTRTTLYLVELKLNQNAEIAMKQIDLQQYADRFALCGLPVVKVAINFSAETRTIADWVISRGTYA